MVGRFLQEDTYRGDGLNLYAYCANNPVMYYDPSGHGKTNPCTSTEQEKQPVTQAGQVREKTSSDEFFIDNWDGYPDAPKPEGPFRILEGDEYDEA